MAENNLRRFLYRAHDLDMTSSDYVYIFYWLIPSRAVYEPWWYADYDTIKDFDKKEAFGVFKQVTMAF